MSPPHDSEREARLLRLSSNAPTVVPLLSSEWITGGHFLLTFPFLPCDLAQLLDQKQLTLQRQKVHLRALFTALDHVHAQGILHRDIKPSNMLSRGPDGPAYLADFGIAWQADDPASEPADQKITDVGTTCYRAPELLFGYKAYTEKLDMWAAGCVVAECLRDGKTLFDAGDLGSELALLRSIFTTLGTPTDEVWPEARKMPDWGKMQFTKYPRQDWQDVLPGIGPKGTELVDQLVRFQSTERLSAAEVGSLKPVAN
jgi:cyclin-dependent kinase